MYLANTRRYGTNAQHAHVDVACELRGLKFNLKFLYYNTVYIRCIRETKSLVRLCVCTCLSKTSLLIDAISTKISCASLRIMYTENSKFREGFIFANIKVSRNGESLCRLLMKVDHAIVANFECGKNVF